MQNILCELKPGLLEQIYLPLHLITNFTSVVLKSLAAGCQMAYLHTQSPKFGYLLGGLRNGRVDMHILWPFGTFCR
jgi:hypothetical protein